MNDPSIPPYEDYAPPMAILVPPGPGIGMALVWWLTFLVLAQVMVGGAILLPFIIINGPDAMNKPDDFMAMVSVPAITAGNLLVAVGMSLLLLGKDAGRLLALRRLDPRQLFLVVLFVLPLGILTNGAAAEAKALFQLMPGNLDTLLDDKLLEKFSLAPWPIVFIGGCLFPGLGEEIFCRGFLGRGLVARHGVLAGVFLTSMLFGLLHVQPVQVVGTLVAGVGLQIVFLSCKSLWGAIAAHTLYNSLAFGYGKAYESMDDPVFPWYLVLASVAASLGLCWLFFAMRTRWILPDGREWSPGFVTTEAPPTFFGAVARVRWPGLAPTLVGTILYLGFVAILVREFVATGLAPVK